MRMREVKKERGWVVVVFFLFTMQAGYPWMVCCAQETINATTSTSNSSFPTTPDSQPAVVPDLSPYPFIVAIATVEPFNETRGFSHLAGGLIVSELVVLTSCQIIKNRSHLFLEYDSVIVVAGTSRIGWGMSKYTQMRHADKQFVHTQCMVHAENTEDIDTKYNVGAVTLTDPFIFNKYVQPMALSSDNKDVLNNNLNDIITSGIPCNKTAFVWINHTTWFTFHTEYEDNITRDIAGSIEKWTTAVDLKTYPAQLISTSDCRSKFCMLSTVGCKHDFSLHNQVCSQLTKIPREYPPNAAHGTPIVCNGYVFGMWNFRLHKFKCSPDVYSNPDCILSFIDEIAEYPSFIF